MTELNVAVAGGLIATVVGGPIVAGVIWSLKHLWAASRQGVAAADEEFERTTKENAASQLTVLREQVRDIAREQSLRVADDANGHNPTLISYTDGYRSWHFSDHAAYKRALARRQAPPLHSRVGEPPHPLSQWDEKALRDWLDEHATP